MNLRNHDKPGNDKLLRFTSKYGKTVYEYNTDTNELYMLRDKDTKLEHNGKLIKHLANGEGGMFKLIDKQIYTGWKQFVEHEDLPLHVVS